MRFKIDENLPTAAAAVFAAAGHDAHTTAQDGLDGANDPRIAEVCRREARALVTFDLDFADLRTYPPAEYPGLIVLRLSVQTYRHVSLVLRRLLPLLDSEPVRGRLWLVGDGQVRIR